jgi:hypothetical protein
MKKLIELIIIISGIGTLLTIYIVIINPTVFNLKVLLVCGLTAYISCKLDDKFNTPSL